MATNYKSSQSVGVYLANESATGTAYTTATSWVKLPTISFSMPEQSTAVEVGSQRAGSYTTLEAQTLHRRDNKLYTFDTSIRGNASMVIQAFRCMDIGSSSPLVLNENYTPPAYADATATGDSVTILFKNAGGDATNTDLQVRGCVATSVTMKEAIDSENGDLVLDISWVTAYEPTYVAQTLTNPTHQSGFKNIKDLTTYNIDPNGGVASQDLEIFSWELNWSRTIERISCKDFTNYLPYGYAMTGLMEVTGSIVAKKDDATDDIRPHFSNDDYCTINIAGGNLTIAMNGAKINDAQTDSGANILRQTIPFTCYALTTGASAISSVTIS